MSDELDFKSQEEAQSCFWEALNRNQYELIEEMMQPGKSFYPNINKYKYFTPPILSALANDNLHMLSALFVAGADLEVVAENGWTFAHELTKKSPNLINKLAEHVNFAVTTPDGLTPLMFAISEKNWEVVDTLFKTGRPLRAYSGDREEDNNAAHMLAKDGQYGLLKSLVESTEDSFEAFRENYKGQTPFDFIENENFKKELEQMVLEKEATFKGIYIADLIKEKASVMPVKSDNLEESAVTDTEVKDIPTMAPKKMGMGGIKKNFK